MTKPPPERTQLIEHYASQCVKCALCLPHCPTYEITRDENESPRGRIALFQAISRADLPLTPQAKKHLDQCLGCRACEHVCPAHVEYGQLLIQGRAALNELAEKPVRSSFSLRNLFISWLLRKPPFLRVFHWVLWSLQLLGIRRLATALKVPQLLGLQPLEEILPPLDRPLSWQSHYAALGNKRGKVMLFKGCVSSLCDQKTLAASIYVLRRLGYDVLVPADQTCCGAMALHAGNIEQTQALAQQNLLAFAAEEVDAIITLATGCGAVLQAYDDHLSSQPNSNLSELRTFSAKIKDIVQFIQQCQWPQDVIPHAMPLRAILHTPCTRRNVLKDPYTPERLLARIPQLTCYPFKNPQCCGAAGTYFLEHPEFAAQLGQKLLSELDNIQVNMLVTTNVGCALHLLHQLKKNHIGITVSHPVTLLARSLGFNG